MAIHFDGSNHGMYIDQAVVTGAPLTIAGWFYPDQVNFRVVGCVSNSGETANNTIALIPDHNQVVEARTRSTVTKKAVTSTQYSLSQWQHGVAVFAAADDRRVYLDGGNKDTDGGSATPNGIDRTAVCGFCYDANNYNLFLGDLEYVSMWDVALTDAEVLRLFEGANPRLVRPDDLVFLVPLYGADVSAEIDMITLDTLNIYTGTPTQSSTGSPVEPLENFI